MSIYRMRTQFGGMLKFGLIGIALIFLIGAFWSFGTAPGQNPNQKAAGDDTVATVNGVPITRGEFESVVDDSIQKAKMYGQVTPLMIADIKASQIQQLAMQMALLAAAEQKGVDVSERKVDDEVNKQVTAYLKQNREVVLGKLSKKQAALDPREDEEYIDELSRSESSIARQEEAAKAKIPASAIKAQLAYTGLMDQIKSSAKKVTKQDVKDSYNNYTVGLVQIQPGSMPKEQVKSFASKIQSEIRGGADPAKVAKDNAKGAIPVSGRVMQYSFETSFMMPGEVGDAIGKTNTGEVSPVIETPQGMFIVKVISLESKMPAGIDKKKLDERKKMIGQMRENTALMAFSQELQSKMRVDVTDPELSGYWYLGKARQSMNQADYMKNTKLAMAAFQRAIKQRPDNYYATAKLAQLYFQDNNPKKTISYLYPMLEGETASVEGSDLRMLLGDAYAKVGEKDKAVGQYKIASEVSRNDINTHTQLVQKFQSVGRSDLVATENAQIADIQKRMKELEAMRGKPAPAPAAPKTKE